MAKSETPVHLRGDVNVTFTKTKQYQCEGRRKGPIYEKGKSYDFTPEFAQRWVSRGVAYITKEGEPESEVEVDETGPVSNDGPNHQDFN